MTNLLMLLTLTNGLLTFQIPAMPSSPRVVGYEVVTTTGDNYLGLEIYRAKDFSWVRWTNTPAGNFQVNEVFANGYVSSNSVTLADGGLMAAPLTNSAPILVDTNLSATPISVPSAPFTLGAGQSMVFSNWLSPNYQIFATTNPGDSTQYLYDWGYLTTVSNMTDYTFSWQLIGTGSNFASLSFTNPYPLPVAFYTNYLTP